MTTGKSHDIRERTFAYALEVVALVTSLPNSSEYWVFRDQIMRSGTSIGANCAEAVSSATRKEFARYNGIALKSARETQYWLRLMAASGLASDVTTAGLLEEVEELIRMLASTVKRLRTEQ